MDVFTNIGTLVQANIQEDSDSPLEFHHNVDLAVSGGSIVAVAPSGDHAFDNAENYLDLGGRAVLPGLVDSHTHLLFPKERIDEFERRIRGESYEAIAKAGGGILNTAAFMSSVSERVMVQEALQRIDTMLKLGVTTVEVKSGYGLSRVAELKQLRAIESLKQSAAIDIVPTLLAHTIPENFEGGRDAYVQMFCADILPAAREENLADYCDVFVESTAFSHDEARLIATTAVTLGMSIKLHVDQLRDGRGAKLAADLRALSADHLEFTGQEGAKYLAQAGVVATILPGCPLFLGKGPWPNARMLRDEGCEVAVATDCNPGSSMIESLALCALLASTQCGLSLEESLWAITRGGAKALGLSDRGGLHPHERADFVVLEHTDWRALLYRASAPPIHAVYRDGQRIDDSMAF